MRRRVALTHPQTKERYLVIAMSRAALVAAIALTLAACSSGATTNDADSLTIADAWTKAADSGMTAAFGEITNTSGHDITVVSATSTASPMVELHEVVDSVMRPVDGGFVIPANSTFTLQPGGYHIMFMDVPSPIKPGDDVPVTLTLGDGSTLTFSTVAKDFTGANEDYDGGMDMGDGMDMSADPSAHPSMSPSASMGH